MTYRSNNQKKEIIVKNFYYAKTQKTYEDLYLVPSQIHRSGKRYRTRRTLNPERDTYTLWLKVATKSVDTTFYMDIYQYDTRLPSKRQRQASMAHMDNLVKRYTNRNPAFSFAFDPTRFIINRFDEHGRHIADDSSKHHQAPRQGFGTAIYRRFTRKTHNRLNR